jgi:hypothetical protein
VLDDGRRLATDQAPKVSGTQDAIRAAALIAKDAGTAIGVYRSQQDHSFQFGPLTAGDPTTKALSPLEFFPASQSRYFERTKFGVLGAELDGSELRAIVTPTQFASWTPGTFDGGVLPIDSVGDVTDVEPAPVGDDVVLR